MKKKEESFSPEELLEKRIEESVDNSVCAEFNAFVALKPLDGKKMRGSELLRALADIRIANYRVLPIEFTSDDLYMIAVQNKWISEEDGLLKVHLTTEPNPFIKKEGF